MKTPLKNGIYQRKKAENKGVFCLFIVFLSKEASFVAFIVFGCCKPHSSGIFRLHAMYIRRF
jgi:hypothetical protein